MKIICILSVILFSVVCKAAEEPKYPKAIKSFAELPFRSIAQKQLPSGVLFMVSQGLESNEDPEFTGPVCYFDLNEDGVDEIIVKSQSTRSNIYSIYQKRKNRWVSILDIEGVPKLLSKRNGYYQIEVSNGDRHGTDTRELFSFSGQRYHIIRLDKYQDEKFTGTSDTSETEKVLEMNYQGQFNKK